MKSIGAILILLCTVCAKVRSLLQPTKSRVSLQCLFSTDAGKRQNVASVAHAPEAATDNSSNPWLSQGFLISSFNDGLLPNPKAHVILRQELITSILRERQQELEETVRSSVLASPCCGPTNVDALNALDDVDAWLDGSSPGDDRRRSSVFSPTTALRLLYIPTAMYALKVDSTNTPGKQRQRARADAKKRRNEVVKLLEQLLLDIPIHTVTLDLDDGSLKQPQPSGMPSLLPTSAKDALCNWQPHLVYIQGGNTFWLHHCVEKGPWRADLYHLLQNTFTIGASAGAILLGQSVETAFWKGWDDPRVVPGKENYTDWQGTLGLGLVGNYSFFPHMTNEWADVVASKSQGTNGDLHLCTLADHQVYHVDGVKKRITLYE